MMHETQWRGWDPGGYWTGTNFYAYGMGKATELAVTSYNLGTPLAPNVSTGIGFKSAPQLFKKSLPRREIKWTFGQMAVLNHRGSGLGSFTYSHVSFRIAKMETRFTGGYSFATRQLFQVNKGAWLAGIEHPVNRRVTLLTEWVSGRHDFGFAIPGVLFHLPRNQILVVGYKIPNYLSNGRHGLVLEYGITFGGRNGH